MRKLQGHEIAIGVLAATAVWVLIFVLTSDAASHYEVCETTKEGAKECANYNIVSLAYRKIGASLDVFSALITAIATIFIARFTFTLKRSTDNLWEAGERQRLLSEDTARRQLRAYVFPDNSEIRKFGFDQPPEGWLLLKNTGSTPAYKLERRGSIMLTQFPAQTFPPLDWTTPSAKSDLGPGGEVNFGPIGFDRALTNAEIEGVMKGRYAIYLWGEIRYVDAFDKPRTTKFRYFHRGNGTPQFNTVMTTHDTEGNESD